MRLEEIERKLEEGGPFEISKICLKLLALARAADKLGATICGMPHNPELDKDMIPLLTALDDLDGGIL